MQTGSIALCMLTGTSLHVYLQDSLPLFIVITKDPHHGYPPSISDYMKFFGLGGEDTDGRKVHQYVMSKIGTAIK